MRSGIIFMLTACSPKTKVFEIIIMGGDIHYYFNNIVHNICVQKESFHENEIHCKMSVVQQGRNTGR